MSILNLKTQNDLSTFILNSNKQRNFKFKIPEIIYPQHPNVYFFKFKSILELKKRSKDRFFRHCG